MLAPVGSSAATKTRCLSRSLLEAPRLGLSGQPGLKLEGIESSREYEVVLSPEAEGGCSVFVPDLPRVATQGETREEALAMAKEAIEGTSRSWKKTDCRFPRWSVAA